MKVSVLVAVFAPLLLFVANGYAATPAGCPSGPAGTVPAGSVCPDGSTPVKDGTLPLFCPGGAQQGAVPTSYTVVCPARPGRAECTFAEATKTCTPTDATAPAPAFPDYGKPFKTNAAGDCGDAYNNCITRDIQVAINVLSIGVGVVITIMIVIAGLQYMTARDNPQSIQAAKTKITNAVIALVAFVFVYAFLQWIVPGGIF